MLVPRRALLIAGMMAPVAACSAKQSAPASTVPATAQLTPLAAAPSTTLTPLAPATSDTTAATSAATHASAKATATASHAGATSTATGTASSSASAGATASSTVSASNGVLPARAAIVANYQGMKPTEWGLDIPGMVTTLGSKGASDNAIALTFDACGGDTEFALGNGWDLTLITLLRKYQVKATLFLNERWINANPLAAVTLWKDPLFEIGVHGVHHSPLSVVAGKSAYGIPATSSVGGVYDEIAADFNVIKKSVGSAPKFMRSGTCYTDDVAQKIVNDMGMKLTSFSVNGDEGATLSAQGVAGRLASAKGGDVVISHMCRPDKQTAAGYAIALPALLKRGLKPVFLSEYV